jgi:acetoin utilization deacetylase AcuC-like enzyme
MTANTPVFYHPAQEVSYDFISVSKIPEFIRQSVDLGAACSDFEPYSAADFEEAHDRAYVRGVLEGTASNGFGTIDPELTNSLLYSNAGHWAAARHVLQHGGVACSATQGFHHAHFGDGYGYCTFNGLVITAAKALRNGVQRVLIIDGDGHYGDGTEDVLDRTMLRDRVMHITRPDIGRIIHSHWNTAMWRSFAKDLIRSAKPGIILYQAGADAWDQDPYGVGYLSKEGLAARDRGIFTAARDAGVPLVWNLAGGYAEPMQDTIDIHLQTLKISDEVYHATTTVLS